MENAKELSLREQIAFQAIAWHEENIGPFEGKTADEISQMIKTAHIISDEARLAVHRWVDVARRADMSWSDIGGILGISKQAAQQRFGGGMTLSDAPFAEEHDTDVITRSGVTSFNEVSVMNEEGARGRELIGVGPFKMMFRQTDQIWQHQRISAASRAAAMRALEGDDWQFVDSWLFFHYVKRPTTTV